MYVFNVCCVSRYPIQTKYLGVCCVRVDSVWLNLGQTHRDIGYCRPSIQQIRRWHTFTQHATKRHAGPISPISKNTAAASQGLYHDVNFQEESTVIQPRAQRHVMQCLRIAMVVHSMGGIQDPTTRVYTSGVMCNIPTHREWLCIRWEEQCSTMTMKWCV